MQQYWFCYLTIHWCAICLILHSLHLFSPDYDSALEQACNLRLARMDSTKRYQLAWRSAAARQIYLFGLFWQGLIIDVVFPQ